jgi:guanyl-specific ribonuclease Sa
MAILSTTDISATLVKPNIEPVTVNLVKTATPFVDFLIAIGRLKKLVGSFPKQWNLVVTGNTSAAEITEHSAYPTAQKRAFQRASVSPFYLAAAACITGQVLDQIMNGGTFEDALQGEIADAVRALKYLLETNLLGTTVNRGLLSIVEGTDAYGGIDPATYTLHASQETNSVGTLDMTDMLTHWAKLRAYNVQSTPTVILANHNQITNYTNIGGIGSYSSGGTNAVVRKILDGGPFDLGMNNQAVAFNGVPFVEIVTLLNTVMVFLDLNMDKNYGVYLSREIRVEDIAKTNDNTEKVVTVGACHIAENRRAHSKMDGITA